MRMLQEFAPFIKGQIEFHERRAKNPDYAEDRKKLHANTAAQFRELLEAIEKMPVPVPASSNPLVLTADDLAGLPPELLKELNVSDSDKIEALIVDLVNAAGGTLILDKILIGLFKATGQVHQREQTISRIYRMTKKDMVFSVPRKKGIYTTTKPVTDVTRRLISVRSIPTER